MQEVEGWVRGQPCRFLASPIDAQGHILREDAALAFARMAEAASTDGLAIEVNAAFRPHAEQQRLYEMHRLGKRKILAARPGWSMHESGCAIDIDVFDNAGQAKPILEWLKTNAIQFGFANTVASEPWHWSFLGGAI